MAPQSESPVAIKEWLFVGRRLVIWAVFIALLYWLRSFFLLIFLTFVFAYSAARAVGWLERRVPKVPRNLLVVGVFLGCLGAAVGLGFLLVPKIDDEVTHFKDQFPKYRDAVVQGYEQLREKSPEVAQAADKFLAQIASVRDNLLGGGAEGEAAQSAPSHAASGFGGLSIAVDWISGFVAGVFSAISTIFLALLFAFMAVVDQKGLKTEVEGFESSRVGWLYREVRETLIEVGASVGSILEAFAIISFVETLVIVAVLWILGVPSLLLLGVITFFFGLIPLVGQIAPIIPIGWIAFAHGGTPLLVKSLIAYSVVRLVAGYTFEPRVFGARFKFGTLFTLITLMIGFKAAGIWGIILGLPVVYSIVRPRANPNKTPQAAP